MPFDFARRVIHELSQLKQDPSLLRYVAHNKKVFHSGQKAVSPKPVALFELNAMQSAHIAYSYLANVLATNNKATVVAYAQKPLRGAIQKFLFFVRKLTWQNEFGVYRSFGTTAFIQIALSKSQKVQAQILFEDTYCRLKTKLDIENLTINDVWVGDLIYDSFLMTHKQPTIDKESPEFKRSLLESIECFVFWNDYFDNHDVRGISVSHCVYNLAIPLRIAVKRKIPAFHVNACYAYRLNSGNLFAYNDFIYFRERFAALPPKLQKAGIAEAQQRIKRRFAGEIGVDMAYSSKSAYVEAHHVRLLRESPRKKILIATHCFFDSPHSYGNNLFPDFYEWLDFLGKMTNETDYDWYIKTHPDYLAGTKEIIDGFVAKYPKFTLLPADASHHQIIAEGISCALTVYGTIAFEYAALGIPVINASQNNPHIAYDFNLHARDIEDYRRLLLGLDELDFTIDKQQVYEYYFMRHIFNTEDLFFTDYQFMVDQLDGYDNQFSPLVYGFWLNEWSIEKHREIISSLQCFIHSGDFRMDHRHNGRNGPINLI